jgi:ribosomal protein S18 acetylase RimI-like enzyme
MNKILQNTSKLYLNNFKQTITIKNNMTNIFKEYKMEDSINVINNNLSDPYYQSNLIGYIYYNIHIGKVDILYVSTKYRNKGLGKQMLSDAINDMKNHNLKEVWCTASKNHEFWNNVYNKSFTFNNNNSNNIVTFRMKF